MINRRPTLVNVDAHRPLWRKNAGSRWKSDPNLFSSLPSSLSLLSKNGRNSPKCQSIQSYIYIIFPYSDNFPFSQKSGGTFPPSISFLPKSRNTAGGSSPRGSIRCIDVAGTRLAINHQGKGSTLGILAVPSGLARVWYACRFHPWRVIMRLDRETETETELREDRAFRYREQGALFVKKSAGQRPRVTSRGKW